MKYKLSFFKESRRIKEECRIRWRILWGGNICCFLINYKIDPEKWSKDTQRCKRATYHGKNMVSSSIINAHLQQIEDKVRDLFNSVDNPTKEQILVAVGKKTETRNLRKIADLVSEYLEDKESRYSTSESTVVWLSSFFRNNFPVDKDKDISSIDEEMMASILKTYVDNGAANSSINLYIRIIKTFLRWVNKKYGNINPSSLSFTPKLKRVNRPIIFLTWQELMDMWNHKFDEGNEMKEVVRDIYCFCCFTSLRISDAMNLRISDIKEDSFTITTKKTSDTLTIDLNKYSRDIINKYKGRGTSYLFPRVSYPNYERTIRKIAEECKIDSLITIKSYSGNKLSTEVLPKYRLITSHTARKTFISNAIMLGIPVSTIMKWTGHKTYQVMKAYIDISDESKKTSMMMFDNLPSS